MLSKGQNDAVCDLSALRPQVSNKLRLLLTCALDKLRGYF